MLDFVELGPGNCLASGEFFVGVVRKGKHAAQHRDSVGVLIFAGETFCSTLGEAGDIRSLLLVNFQTPLGQGSFDLRKHMSDFFRGLGNKDEVVHKN